MKKKTRTIDKKKQNFAVMAFSTFVWKECTVSGLKNSSRTILPPVTHIVSVHNTRAETDCR